MVIHNLLPKIEDCYDQQSIGMHGNDLEEEQEVDVRARALKIPFTPIQQVKQEHFIVRSSNQDFFYSIHSVLNECNCEDFPSVKLCTHLAATQHDFGGSSLLS
jgi:hypothetical protein